MIGIDIYVRYPHAAQRITNKPSSCILSIVVMYIWDGMDSHGHMYMLALHVYLTESCGIL